MTIHHLSVNCIFSEILKWINAKMERKLAIISPDLFFYEFFCDLFSIFVNIILATGACCAHPTLCACNRTRSRQNG